MSDFALGVLVGAIAATLVARLVQSLLAIVLPVAIVAGVIAMVGGLDHSKVMTTVGPLLQRLGGPLFDWSTGRLGPIVDLLRTLLKL